MRLYQEPSVDRAVFTLLSLLFPAMIFAARLQILKVQNRVIRLEERLRYTEVLPAELASRASELKLGQTIALRFASDEELAELFRRACDRELSSAKEIKLAVKNWRGDYDRA